MTSRQRIDSHTPPVRTKNSSRNIIGVIPPASVTSEYRVEHPRWNIWPANSASFKADVSSLYGDEFVAPLSAAPASRFIAEGSHVQVWRKFDDPVPIEALTANPR